LDDFTLPISHYIGPLKAEFVWKYEG
jgi:hypothetical protein